MAYAAVGTIPAVTTGASAAAVTPAWGASQNRTANNLLLLLVHGNAAATFPAAPSGWSTAIQVASGSSNSESIFYKVAAGSDAAPTVAGVASVALSAMLMEFSGGAATTPLDRTASNNGTTSPLAATTAGVDAALGELVVMAGGIKCTPAAATTSHTPNNGASATTLKSNDATATGAHYNFAYGTTTGISAADSDSFAFTTATGAAIAVASFKLSSAASLTRTASDAVASISDAASPGAYASARPVSDTVAAISDTAARATARARAVADTVSLSEAVSRGAYAPARSAGDTVSLSDTAARSLPVARSAAEVVAIADAATRAALALARASAESIILTDAASRLSALTRALSDTVTLADLAAKGSTASRAAADAVAIADALGRTLTAVRSAGDLVVVLDAGTRTPSSALRSSADPVTLTDVARLGSFRVSAFDLFSVADAVARVVGSAGANPIAIVLTPVGVLAVTVAPLAPTRVALTPVAPVAVVI